ncbi:MAG: hypothetical protein ABJC12_12015, partial [Saprospiraceae bacterium]
MLKHAIQIFILSLLLFSAQKLSAHVVLDYPVGGETFIVGQEVIINWHIAISHPQLNWDLYFSSDGGNNWEPLQLDMPVSQLSYTWIVPNLLTTLGRIRIFQDNQGQDYLDFSLNFNIAANTNPPLLDAPATDTTIQSNTAQSTAIQSWLTNHGGASATNFCGNLNWTNNYNGLSYDCGASGTAIVTFTAADGCGFTTTTAILNIIDDTPPMIDLPALNMVVQCNGSGNVPELNNWIDHTGGAHGSDVSGIFWSNDYSSISNSCGATGEAFVTFKATDGCGNTSTTNASFTIEDHVAPNLILAAIDTTIECSAAGQNIILQNWLNKRGGATSTDVCGNIIWSNNYSSLSNDCGSSGNVSVVFKATDDCGNFTTTQATFSIEDHVAPNILSLARDTSIECGTPNQDSIIQMWLAQNGGAFASDICSNVAWSNNYSALSAACGASGNAIVTFIATDDCGNMTSTTAAISVEDHLPPTIVTPAKDTTIECGQANQDSIVQHWLETHGGAVANDLCGNVNWSNDSPLISATCDDTGCSGRGGSGAR